MIINKSEVSNFPIVFIFFRGCAPEVVVSSYAAISIYILVQQGFVSFIAVQFYDVRKKSSILWPYGGICVFAHHYTTSLQ